ncbi:DUF3833 family protein [Prosthecobacter sp.]|uniref:DUF3833 family protein n=1 Tax=Prosthecobacter sp. TaxID=1965333 RepID=UPI00378466D4
MSLVSHALAWVTLGLCLCGGLASCSGSRARDFADKGPPLDPKAYFSGHLQSSGMVQNHGGKVRDEFTTRIHGVPSQKGLLLIQDFTFASGRKVHRVWDIDVLDAHHFEGEASDGVGLARGEAWGNAFEWNYTLAVPKGGRKFDINFHQIMLLQPDGTLLNRAQFGKFGLRLGTVTESFRKLPR